MQRKENLMNTIQINDTVDDVVALRPAVSQVFDEAGIDYCREGKKTLDAVCRDNNLDSQAFLAMLNESAHAAAGESIVDTEAMSLTELADHIQQTHHTYLRVEFPRLDEMMEKVTSVHGERNPRLHQIREAFFALAGELSSHMMKEEQILFPMVRQLEVSDSVPMFHCGSLANPIRQMESEHTQAGSALDALRELTDGYTPPDWACNTYRAMLDALARLEQDLLLHIHKESNMLFPRTLKMESEKGV
jgi:regulator of cell morphogenesis and NO signaling